MYLRGSKNEKQVSDCVHVFIVRISNGSKCHHLYTVTSCSQADVQDKIDDATHGDTVEIPAGTCTWSTQVTVNYGITLTGAGQTSTIIKDNVTKDGTEA